MFINADFSHRVVLTPEQHQWVPSPLPGVERMMLDRMGGEKARATSLVRYAPESGYIAHQHPGGEEILVLSGTFSEGDVDHTAGCYLRNPPGSGHQPFTRDGALIFVKLWQMAATERRRVQIDTRDPSHWREEPDRSVCPLFDGPGEQVCLQRLLPGRRVWPVAVSVDGAELLVIEGQLLVGDQVCTPGAWIRLPPGRHDDLRSGPEGATFYMKTGHLAGMIQAPAC